MSGHVTPRIAETARQLGVSSEEYAAHLDRIVDGAPAMTAAQRDQIAVLMRPQPAEQRKAAAA